jgi:hypothetical protein
MAGSRAQVDEITGLYLLVNLEGHLLGLLVGWDGGLQGRFADSCFILAAGHAILQRSRFLV